MPSKGRAGRRGRRNPDAPEAAGDDGEFARDDIWPDDVPARDINEDLEEIDVGEAAATEAAEARSVADPAPDARLEDPVRTPEADAGPQAGVFREPDGGADPDLFDDRSARTPGPSRRRTISPGSRGRRRKAGTAVQLDLWPDGREPGTPEPSGEE